MSLSKKIFWSISEWRRQLQKSAPELKNLHIEITGRCNLQCHHCYMSSFCDGKDTLSTSDWCQFFDSVRRDFGTKVAVQISGGEPLLRADIFDILNHLKQSGFVISMVTNGTLLTEKVATKLSHYVPSLSISLDGFANSHNYLRGAPVFDVVSNNIRHLKSAGFKYVFIKTTVYKRNLADLAEFRDYVRSLGVDGWHIFAMEPIGRGNENRQDLLSLQQYRELCDFADQCRYDRSLGLKFTFGEGLSELMCDRACEACRYHRCGAGIAFCGIRHTGDIVGCLQDERSRQPIYGNIKQHSLKKVWRTGFGETRCLSYNYCDNHFYLNQLAKEYEEDDG